MSVNMTVKQFSRKHPIFFTKQLRFQCHYWLPMNWAY